MHQAIAELELKEQQELLRIATHDGDANVDACAVRLIRKRLRGFEDSKAKEEEVHEPAH
jgi:hypothetical protein